jgi:Autotransporter beta-domain
VLPALGVTPYAALQAQDFHTPSFSETDAAGGGLGLNFAAMNATDVRSELGTRLDHPMLVAGMPLIVRGRSPGRTISSTILRSARCSNRCPDRASWSMARRSRRIQRRRLPERSCYWRPIGR